jgi:hypothetical protein
MAIANLLTFTAATAAILLFTGLVLKVYWSIFMIGWGML